MSETLKILGQVSPAATTLTSLYTVPGLTRAVISSLVVCNQNASAITFRVSAAIAGAGDTPAQYLFYDVTLVGNASFTATLGLTLAQTDVVRCYASTTGVSFNLFGSEVT